MTLLEAPQTLIQAVHDQPLPNKIALLIQTLQALAYLHRRGIIHRDLKPANVLVMTYGILVASCNRVGLLERQNLNHEAYQMGMDTLKMATEMDAKPIVADTLVNLAKLAWKAGLTQCAVEQAAFVALWQHAQVNQQQEAAETLGAIEPETPPEAFARFKQQGEHQTAEALVQRAIDAGNPFGAEAKASLGGV